MLRSIYNEHVWHPWKFTRVPRSWKKNSEELDIHTLRAFVEDLGSAIGIKELHDWYQVTIADIRASGARYILQNLGGLPHILMRVYPHHNWQLNMFSRKIKKSLQHQLGTRMTSLRSEIGEGDSDSGKRNILQSKILKLGL